MKRMQKQVNVVLMTGVAIASALFVESQAFAQMTEKSGEILLAMANNAKRMVRYEWKQKITVIRKGRPAQPVVDQVRFDSSGKLQRTTLSAPPPQTGIRGRVAAGVKEDVKGMMEIVARYNKPQQMIAAIQKAQVSRTASAIQLQSSGVVKPGDSMTMLVNPATHLATHVDIKTDYEGDPMTIAQDYAPIPDGPNMMKSMEVSVPGKSLTIDVASYDFAQQTAEVK